eukprot:GHUV01042433.1.p3 GENE.GHUV01042433.1~~GHUV01042433.1.p3  ORF type:complete len:135 (+),score=22.11 GHUV01042433.1:212-616(+)
MHCAKPCNRLLGASFRLVLCSTACMHMPTPYGSLVAAPLCFQYAFMYAACRTCYEVACDNKWISDNYGQKLDRTYSCYDDQQSVVVRITDTCPCVYAPNEYSNRRWCCNDMDHFDMSVWAWEKLADKEWGVIGG